MKPWIFLIILPASILVSSCQKKQNSLVKFQQSSSQFLSLMSANSAINKQFIQHISAGLKGTTINITTKYRPYQADHGRIVEKNWATLFSKIRELIQSGSLIQLGKSLQSNSQIGHFSSFSTKTIEKIDNKTLQSQFLEAKKFIAQIKATISLPQIQLAIFALHRYQDFLSLHDSKIYKNTLRSFARTIKTLRMLLITHLQGAAIESKKPLGAAAGVNATYKAVLSEKLPAVYKPKDKRYEVSAELIGEVGSYVYSESLRFGIVPTTALRSKAYRNAVKNTYTASYNEPDVQVADGTLMAFLDGSEIANHLFKDSRKSVQKSLAPVQKYRHAMEKSVFLQGQFLTQVIHLYLTENPDTKPDNMLYLPRYNLLVAIDGGWATIFRTGSTAHTIGRSIKVFTMDKRDDALLKSLDLKLLNSDGNKYFKMSTALVNEMKPTCSKIKALRTRPTNFLNTLDRNLKLLLNYDRTKLQFTKSRAYSVKIAASRRIKKMQTKLKTLCN